MKIGLKSKRLLAGLSPEYIMNMILTDLLQLNTHSFQVVSISQIPPFYMVDWELGIRPGV